ncbi:uncharacterized protein TNCV_1592221 [Trichonephila clavipes]|nr:uncharacterized protein TNCV_1592221 [Trichonephila clavipes]
MSSCDSLLFGHPEETFENEVLQIGQQTQGRCEGLGLVTGYRNCGIKESFGLLINGIVVSGLSIRFNESACLDKRHIGVEKKFGENRIIISLKQLAVFVKEKVRDDQGCNWYPTVIGSAYLDALQLWLFPQSEESEPNNFIWQQDGAPPHWHLSVREWLNMTVPNQWIGRKEPPDKACIAWLPRSPDLTPCDLYLWELIKDYMYVPPFPADLPDLRHRIEAAAARISSDTLKKVWDELAYRLDVCCVKNGVHIEHL